MAIVDLSITYDNFSVGDVIDSEKFDVNNSDVETKVNEIIAILNAPGDGLSQSIVDNTLSVNVDDSTIEIDTNTLRVKDAGITDAKLASDAVTTVKIADANVTTAKILDANVTADKLANNAVTTAKVANANITADKLASDSVITAKILDANVTTAKIANGNVTTVKIADGSITTDKILDANVTDAKLASTVATTATANTLAKRTSTGMLPAIVPCVMLISNSQSISNSASPVLISFASEEYDTNTMHESVINPTRITIKTAGKYMISYGFQYPGGTIGEQSFLHVAYKNGSVLLASNERLFNGIHTTTYNYSYFDDLSINDYIEFGVSQQTGSTKDYTNIFFEAHLISY